MGDTKTIKVDVCVLFMVFNCQLVRQGISSVLVTGIIVLNRILIVLSQWSNKSTLLSPSKTRFYEYKNPTERRRKKETI
jgi:hypothetical protein